jgi:hypothetical protein
MAFYKLQAAQVLQEFLNHLLSNGRLVGTGRSAVLFSVRRAILLSVF